MKLTIIFLISIPLGFVFSFLSKFNSRICVPTTKSPELTTNDPCIYGFPLKFAENYIWKSGYEINWPVYIYNSLIWIGIVFIILLFILLIIRYFRNTNQVQENIAQDQLNQTSKVPNQNKLMQQPSQQQSFPQTTSQISQNSPAIPQAQTPKKSIIRYIIVSIIIILIIISSYFYYIKFSTRKVVVKDYKTHQDYISFTKPGGWVSDPYWPKGTGSALRLFGSKKDQKLIEDSTSIYNDELIGARSIYGLVLTNPPGSRPLEDYDIFSKSHKDFDKILIENQYFINGKYRCLQRKNNEKYQVNCWVINKKLINYILTTNDNHYNKDLSSLYLVIESTEIL